MFRHVLVASDLTDNALPALAVAVDLASKYGAKLTALHVIEPLREARPWVTTLAPPDVALFERFMEQEVEACKKLLREQMARATEGKKLPAVETAVPRGPSSDTIVAEAQARGADLVVVGTHARKGLKHALLGSVAERVVRFATCPVLVAR
jgi:universal stress protein A